MSEIYAVATVGRQGKVAQTSRAGDGWGKVDVAVTAENGGDWTFRLEVTPEGYALFRTPKRWKDANVTPELEWVLIAEGDV